jgi:hypothetical protein
MTSQVPKAARERETFQLFVQRLGEVSDWASVNSCEPPAPDLLCVHVKKGPIAFELVRITDSNIAKSQGSRANVSESAFYTSDPSVRIVRDKLKKHYVTPHPIELLIYTEGQVVTPDDVIIPTVLPWFDAIEHCFRLVWFMSESEVICLWTAS